jgi:hypothetical protein
MNGLFPVANALKASHPLKAMSLGGRDRSETSSRKQINTMAGAIRPSEIPCREFFVKSVIWNAKM